MLFLNYPKLLSVKVIHEKGKMTARERLLKLFDDGSFTEISQFIKHRCTNFNMQDKNLPGDGVVTGYGTVKGRLVFAYAEDFTVEGGSLGEMHVRDTYQQSLTDLAAIWF